MVGASNVLSTHATPPSATRVNTRLPSAAAYLTSRRPVNAQLLPSLAQGFQVVAGAGAEAGAGVAFTVPVGGVLVVGVGDGVVAPPPCAGAGEEKLPVPLPVIGLRRNRRLPASSSEVINSPEEPSAPVALSAAPTSDWVDSVLPPHASSIAVTHVATTLREIGRSESADSEYFIKYDLSGNAWLRRAAQRAVPDAAAPSGRSSDRHEGVERVWQCSCLRAAVMQCCGVRDTRCKRAMECVTTSTYATIV